MATRAPERVKRAYVETPDGQIHYRWLDDDSGRSAQQPSGQPLLLLHQVSSSSRMYERLMPFLGRAGYRPIAMDTLGFGESDPPPRQFSVADYAASIARFLDAHGLTEPLPVLGHHTGAGFAIELAVSRPERVAKLVLVGAPYYVSAEARRKRWAEKKVQPVVPRPDAGHLLHEWERLRDLSPDMDVNLLHRELVDTLKAPRYDLTYEAIFSYDTGARLPLIQCPTLVIAGTRDTLFPGQEPASKLIPGAQLAFVQDGGVFMIDEKTEQIAAIALRFLGSGAA
jgi:haloalkane dehalogenase